MTRHSVPRDPREPHRAATPLELFFDLCFVVAIAQAATGLHHGLSEAHVGDAVLGYGLVFFAIWLAWVNFTWLSSAYDSGDVPYKLDVFAQMTGVLVLAAGVPRAVSGDFTVITLGYVIMRVGLVAIWLRVACLDVGRRRTALRYAAGVVACQAGWIALLLFPRDWWVGGFGVLAPAELLVPAWAESAGRTPWHPHHIAERYGLMTIIVLGESVLAATVAIQSVLDAPLMTTSLAGLIVGAVLILFSMWWVYFEHPGHLLLSSNRAAFQYGYGHLIVFSAIAAVGAGLSVAVDQAAGRTHLSTVAAGAVVAVPVVLYLTSVWVLLHRPLDRRPVSAAAFLLAAAFVLGAAASAAAVFLIGVLMCALLVVLSLTRPAGWPEH
jgi:low temperature requirement protein LtrA